MSDLGYSNQNQSQINISLNNLEDYVADLKAAICTSEPAYQEIGVKVDGKYRQLNANLLQIENEFYSPIRPKRVARSGERPTAALRRDGIEYVEIRSLDINPFDPCGVNQNTMRFVEAFLIYCLLEDSAKFDAGALDEVKRNHTGTAKFGRDPAFRLMRDGKAVAAAAMGQRDPVQGFGGCRDDRSHGAMPELRGFGAADAGTRRTIRMKRLPHAYSPISGKQAAVSSNIRWRSRRATATISRQSLTLPSARKEVFEKEAADSLLRQQQIESADEISLEEYLRQYFSNC